MAGAASTTALLALVLLVACGLPAPALAGHNDMFGCRGGKSKCQVSELGDANFDLSLAVPHFVMFYAPWCGHCKQLAPKLKKAAKALEGSGVKIGAVDVEPNPKVQAKFPDIRGFPTLKFLPSNNPKKAIDYNGAREDDAIVAFAKEQAKAAGVTLAEPTPVKTNTELYTYFGRAALSNLPAMLVVGKAAKNAEPPSWIGKLAMELRKPDPKDPKLKEDPEAETRKLLQDASKATKLAVVKDGIASLLEAIDSEGAKGPPLGPNVVSAAFTSDAAAAAAFGLSDSDLPALVLASVDRKTAGGAYVARTGGKAGGVPAGDAADRKSAAELLTFVRGMLPDLKDPAALRSASPSSSSSFSTSPAADLPAFPKPPNVLAAEERERKRKEREGGVAAVTDASSLASSCYELPAGKTCALLALKGGAAAAMDAASPFSALARKFAKEGFAFAAVDLDAAGAADVVGPLFADAAGGAVGAGKVGLAVVKGGKRPRAASVTVEGDGNNAAGGNAFETLLDSVVGGGASFAKLKGGLPQWPAGEDNDETDSGFADDEL